MKKMYVLYVSCLVITRLAAMDSSADITCVSSEKAAPEPYQRMSTQTYSIEKLRAAHELAKRQQEEWERFAQDIDPEIIERDKRESGPIHGDDYFMQLQFPLLRAANAASSRFRNQTLNVTQCPHTAVDLFPFIKGETSYRLVCIGKWIERLKREKFATTGGITEYGETFEETAVREAREEAHLTDIDKDSLVLLGTRSNKERDPRGRHIASIFYGCITEQMPQKSDEASNVYLLTQAGVESTRAEDWCARDHREMALEAFSRLPEILAKAHSRL